MKLKKENKVYRNYWYSFSLYLAIAWIIGLILLIVGATLDFSFIEHGEYLRMFLMFTGGFSLAFSWLLISVFAIFIILASEKTANKQRTNGIICGSLCLLLPLAGVIMAKVVYHNEIKIKQENEFYRNYWYSYSLYASITWLLGVILIILGAALKIPADMNGFEPKVFLWFAGALMVFMSLIINITFGVFTILTSIKLKGSDKKLGITIGMMCLLFSPIGMILAFFEYNNIINIKEIKPIAKIKYKYKISVKDIAVVSMILAIYISFKFLNKLNPEIMPGLQIQVMDIIVIVSSLIFGSIRTVSAISIFYFIIAWSSQPFFLSGLTWISGGAKNIIGCYLLDYILPHIGLAVIPGLFVFWKNKLSPIIFSLIALILSFAFHVGAGVLFWSSYAWNGWGPIAYSFSANALAYSFAIPMTIIITYSVAHKIRPLFIKNFNQLKY